MGSARRWGHGGNSTGWESYRWKVHHLLDFFPSLSCLYSMASAGTQFTELEILSAAKNLECLSELRLFWSSPLGSLSQTYSKLDTDTSLSSSSEIRGRAVYSWTTALREVVLLHPSCLFSGWMGVVLGPVAEAGGGRTWRSHQLQSPAARAAPKAGRTCFHFHIIVSLP